MRQPSFLFLVLATATLLALVSDSRGQAPAVQEFQLTPAHSQPNYQSFTPVSVDRRDIEAQQQVQSLLKKLSEAKEEATKTDLQKKLTEALGKQFDIRQEAREKELKELEERVKRLRETLEKREKAKESIVKNRLEQLLREADGLGWGDAPHGGATVIRGAYGVGGAVKVSQ